ncbi:MAG TPA: SpoIIE family protein phosphatase [Candidatus Acidoferrales bacterium]|nr:SpoIIE family protein phosphatase [Candidatus Acidoferrales bacterium]
MDFEPPEWLAQIEGILETLNEGVIIADDCPQIIFANANFEAMTGMPRSDFIGSNFDKFFTPEEAETLNNHRDRGMQAGHNRFEFVLPRHDGSRLPVIVSARSIEDPDGRRFAIVTFIDISDQKRAEGNLRTANKQLEERQKEIEEDLVLAARVQQSLAPKSLVWGNAHVETYYHPVRTIGGDFGLVSPMNEDLLNLLVCDVSGHGIGSALVANRIYAETMTQLRNGAPLGAMLRQLNRFVMHNIGSSVFFFTIAAAQLDRAGRRLLFAGAGHPPGMIAHDGAEPRLLESRSMVLGALPDAVGAEATLDVNLEAGDRVVLYTDGITDVFDSDGEMLGIEGVQKIVRETSLLPFKQMKHGILDRVAEWRDGPPTDDVSLVLVEVN